MHFLYVPHKKKQRKWVIIGNGSIWKDNSFELFIWRPLHKALALKSNLIRRNFPLQEECYFCKQHMEDENHLFRDCDLASRIWSSSSLGIRTSSNQIIPFKEWTKNFLQFFWKKEGVTSARVKEFVATLWSIWIYRNNIVFRNLYEDPSTILKRKDDLIRECVESNRIKKLYHPKAPSSEDDQRNISISQEESSQQGVCVILVDGAWKRNRISDQEQVLVGQPTSMMKFFLKAMLRSWHRLRFKRRPLLFIEGSLKLKQEGSDIFKSFRTPRKSFELAMGRIKLLK